MSKPEEMSETQFFHIAGKYRDSDQAELYDPEIMAEIKKDYPGWRRGEQVPREGLPNLERIRSVLTLIASVRLAEPFTDEDARALIGQKNVATKLVQEVFEGIREYMQIIKRIAAFKKVEGAGLDQDQFQAKLTALDDTRTMHHNVMIDNIRIVARYIFQRFAVMPEENLQKLENDFAERGQSLLPIVRVALPPGIILPDGLDLRDRKRVAAWAERVHDESKVEEMLMETQMRIENKKENR